MSWLFSRALVEEYLVDTCLDGDLSAQSNGSLTPQAYLPPDKMTDFSRLSRFGMTFKPLTADRGEELLTLYLEDSRARTLALPEKAQVLTESAAECGDIWLGSLARFDQVSCTWKTAQQSLLGDSDESSVIWPRSGMTAGGQCWELPTLERRTSGTGSGLWRTPTVGMLNADRAKDPEYAQRKLSKGQTITLADQVKDRRMWPTPVATMSKGSSPTSLTRKDGRDRSGDRLDHAVMAINGGQLNPTWVEWLMGWPLGWTDLKPLEMGRFQAWRQQLGNF